MFKGNLKLFFFKELTNNWMLLTELIIDVSIFLIFITLTIMLMYKISSRHLDCISKLIIVSYGVDFTFRLAISVMCVTMDKCLHNNNNLIEINKIQLVIALFISTLDRLKWLILYLFVLEMRSVNITLSSDDLITYKKKLRCHDIIWKLIVVFFIILQIPIVVVQYIRKFNISNNPNNIKVNLKLELIEMILRSLKIPIDIYMFILYFRLLKYFF